MFLDINYFLNKKIHSAEKSYKQFYRFVVDRGDGHIYHKYLKKRAYDNVRKNNSYMFLFLLSGSQKVMVYIFLKSIIFCKI